MHKRVLITGAGSGLGRALAYRWAASGSEICVVDINLDGAEQTCKQIMLDGGKAFAVQADVTSVEEIEQLKLKLLDYWPEVDLLINNAGVASADKFESEPLEQWRWQVELNLMSIVKMSQAFVPLFQKQGHGYILNVSSQAGLTSTPFMSSYNTTKAAVIALSETMNIELSDFDIGVSVLCPSFFKTNLGSSLRTQLPVMHQVLDKLFENAKIDADTVAEMAFSAVAKNRFMITTHKEGRTLYRLKRWLGHQWYLNALKKKTAKYRLKVRES